MITRQPCNHSNRDLRAYDPFITIMAFIYEQLPAALCPAYLRGHMFVFFVYSEGYTSPSSIHI